MGQLPVTCGLFFSLGHSTIVIVVNVAIAISTDVYNHIDGVGAVGGIVGAAVSASFLFVVGLANSIILFRILRKRHRVSTTFSMLLLRLPPYARMHGCAHDVGRRIKKQRAARNRPGEEASFPGTAQNQPRGRPVGSGDGEPALEDEDEDESQGNTLMMKVIGPVVTFVNRPWKMYPVGVLFGFGFDTASSIALLAISAIAQRGPDGRQIASGNIVILPLLFTVGMTLIDSLDSIIMLYSYTGFPDRSFALFERRAPPRDTLGDPSVARPQSGLASGSRADADIASVEELPRSPASVFNDDQQGLVKSDRKKGDLVTVEDAEGSMDDPVRQRVLRVKQNAMSDLSILLTVMSILVAFSISLITIMGLIGDNCTPCQNAANDPDGGGLAGRWWRAWAKANDNSGYIGAAIVGSFIAVVSGVVWGAILVQEVESAKVAKHG
ncbi:hypothetical protein ONZ51_g7756 [Trametes cubensis]|uniref:Nickel/cobalt efflux system n=1 Tax=Trametes cubensis TaxID=1111947 RepID=A0AAD7TRL1_9APHY|nr:hypothetical protein ONZ51_g7756 [Trametes cubensis]